jgi:hypothetical protein
MGQEVQDGVSSVADADRPGRPHTAYTSARVLHLKRLTQENRRVTNDEVALELGIGHGCAHHIMHDVLQYHQVCVHHNWKGHISSAHSYEMEAGSIISSQKQRQGARGGTVGRGTALQVGRSRVRFPMVLLEFFIFIILPAALWLWDRLSL